MTFAGRKVARRNAFRRIAGADQDWLWNNAVRDVAQPHQLPSLQAQRFQTRKQYRIIVERGRRLASTDTEVACPDEHQWHRRIDTSHFDAVNQVNAVARRKDLSGHCAPRIDEIEQDW
ncbi:hypothetical protein C265_27329 [Cupriavidus sp. GA3-3]|nr:hypothetical protein C265_27329 [Cupriavidus sp. GA3-3]